MTSRSIPESSSSSSAAAKKMASDIIRQWPSDRPFHAKEVLQRSPELVGHKSAVLDLAYEEYCRCHEKGTATTLESFADRFPDVRRTLLQLLQVHEYLQQNPGVWSNLTETAWPTPGSTFLDFQLVAVIGRGAASQVYLAKETRLADRPVVVKLTRHSDQETAALGRLQHPNIVPVLSVQSDRGSGISAICMPYLGCATLLDVLDAVSGSHSAPLSSELIFEAAAAANANLPVLPPKAGQRRWSAKRPLMDGVAQIGIQLADALAYAHDRGIYHCDIKPSNVLITSDGTAMLLDFNLSFSDQAATRSIGGTLPYMSPEQLAFFLGQHKVDARSDLFSLGVTLYELLSGQFPFGSLSPALSNPAEQAASLRSRQLAGPKQLAPCQSTGDSAIGRIIEQCLCFDAEDRIQSAGDLAAALRKTQRPTARLRRWINNHKVQSLASALATVTLFSALAVWQITREPYADREIRAGRALVAAGRFEDAITNFGNSLKAEPGRSEALFLRGYSRLKTGQLDLAYRDLYVAARNDDDGAASAALAYCSYRLAGHRGPVVKYLNRALDRGFESAEVHNDLGFCHLKLSDLVLARQHLETAVRLDPTLRIAHFNLCLVELREALRQQRPPELKFVEQAVRLGAPSAECEVDVACTYAYAGRFDTTFLSPALKHCRLAAASGAGSQELQRVALLNSQLKADPRFEALLQDAPSGQQGIRAERFIDPLGDGQFLSQ